MARFGQEQNLGGTIEEGFRVATGFKPVLKSDLEAGYKPYGEKFGNVKKTDSDLSLYKRAVGKVVEWWKKQKTKSTSPAGTAPADAYARAIADYKAGIGPNPGSYQTWKRNGMRATGPVATAPSATATSSSPSAGVQSGGQSGGPTLPDTAMGPTYQQALSAYRAGKGPNPGSYATWSASQSRSRLDPIQTTREKDATTRRAPEGLSPAPLPQIVGPATLQRNLAKYGLPSTTVVPSRYLANETALRNYLIQLQAVQAQQVARTRTATSTGIAGFSRY